VCSLCFSGYYASALACQRCTAAKYRRTPLPRAKTAPQAFPPRTTR
jgi:hypothetical protein